MSSINLALEIVLVRIRKPIDIIPIRKEKIQREKRRKKSSLEKNHFLELFFVWEFIVLTMTTAAMYSVSINSLDIWERVTLGLTEI